MSENEVRAHDCQDHVSIKKTCMQCGKKTKPRVNGKVRVALEVIDEDDKPQTLLVEAKLLGTPMRVKGKAVAFEVLTATGRNTLVPVADITPLDEAAEEMLAEPPAAKAAA